MNCRRRRYRGGNSCLTTLNSNTSTQQFTENPLPKSHRQRLLGNVDFGNLHRDQTRLPKNGRTMTRSGTIKLMPYCLAYSDRFVEVTRYVFPAPISKVTAMTERYICSTTKALLAMAN